MRLTAEECNLLLTAAAAVLLAVLAVHWWAETRLPRPV